MATELSRRQFLKIGGGGLLGLYVGSRLGGFTQVAEAAIPGGTVDLATLPKYTTPLLIPPVMPQAGTIRLKNGKSADYYEISMKQFEQQILPAGMPMTTVWGYGAVRAASDRGLLLHNAPSLTIEAAGRQAGAGQVDQRLEEGQRQVPAPPADRRPDAALGQSARRVVRARLATRVHRDPDRRMRVRCRWSPTSTAPSASATRATATRRPGTCRLQRTSPTATPRRGTWFRFFRRKAFERVRRALGSRLRHVPVPQREPRVDHLVPRSHPRDDPPERLRRPRRLLHRPRRARRRRRGEG